MHTALFSNLKAFFAPTVPSSARAAWTENGGVLATKADASSASSKIDVFVGVREAEDVLVDRLRALGFEVVDVKWMWESLRQEKVLERKPYSLEREPEVAKEASDPPSPSRNSSTEPQLREKQATSTPSPRSLLDRSSAPSPPTAKPGSLILDDPRLRRFQDARESLSPSPAPATAPAASQASTASSGEEAEKEVAAYLLIPAPAAKPAQPGDSTVPSLDTTLDDELVAAFKADVVIKRESSTSSSLLEPSPSFHSALTTQPQPTQPSHVYNKPSTEAEAAPSAGRDEDPPAADLFLPPTHLAHLESPAALFSTLLDHSIKLAVLSSESSSPSASATTALTVLPADLVLSALRRPRSPSPGDGRHREGGAVRGRGGAAGAASMRSGLKEMHHLRDGFEVRKRPADVVE